MRRTTEEREAVLRVARKILSDTYISKGRDFTFTTSHLAEQMGENSHMLARYMKHLEYEGTVKRTDWTSRKRILYRSNFDGKQGEKKP
jgi:hypothetical protein